jgi:hypothetical protein
MKKKKLDKKLMLNAKSIANLNHQEMTETKGMSALWVCTESCSALWVCCDTRTVPKVEYLPPTKDKV